MKFIGTVKFGNNVGQLKDILRSIGPHRFCQDGTEFLCPRLGLRNLEGHFSFHFRMENSRNAPFEDNFEPNCVRSHCLDGVIGFS